ncbi:hypothetical protein [Neoroseomonas soli]|uniref:Uncharacterized protein n=1 Tax=Neoroseomonas soli TaxID=1081025 RepID=A0A9X9WXZ6_9PROT|nr:hypothetical protein [Neoroseomonas soli]MBR0672025.1 hypothetical protein [Neoroseomonas soli]
MTPRRAAVAALLAMVLPGCAVDGIGLARAEVVRADGAVVVRAETLGAALRTDPAEAGLAIGVTRTLTVLPDRDGAPAPGRYPFGLALRGIAPAARIRQVIGLDLGFGGRMAGFTLGYSEDAVFAAVPAGASIIRRLELVPDEPGLTFLRSCEEASRCE